ncbi:MAG: hypothetical protein KJ601_02815 [Nanoarchaeota archaeon]|nr:hypothetical protein [Nanoarchaeota archaeon]MBU1703754.1 hypothetical protein [Nanoarchaeota archaeon]
MNEHLEESIGEMKRIDHLIFVSLKYSRTVDVIKSVIERIISSYDFMILALLEHAKEKKIITEYPQSNPLRCELLLKHFRDDEMITKNLEFYALMRRVTRAEYGKREEYRRHVTMIADIDGNNFEVDIDKLNEYFENIKEFFRYLKEKIENE